MSLGVFVAHNPSSARFTELSSGSSLFKRAFVQDPWAVVGGRQLLGALEGSWLVCLTRSAFIEVTGQVKMLEFISLQIRSWLREQEVSQTLSSETGESHHPSQQKQGGILFQRQACALGRAFANQPPSLLSSCSLTLCCKCRWRRC